MKFGLTFNYVETKEPGPTTVSLVLNATNRGHQAWAMGAADFAYGADDKIWARARCAPEGCYRDAKTYFRALRGPRSRIERITVDDLDLLFLRGDPSSEVGRRPWAQTAAIDFAKSSHATRGHCAQRS